MNPSIDVVYDIGEIRLGSAATNVPARIFPSGKAINVAKAIKTLGEDVRVAGLAHEHNRAQFAGYLESLGISSDFITVPGQTRINVTFAGPP